MEANVISDVNYPVSVRWIFKGILPIIFYCFFTTFFFVILMFLISLALPSRNIFFINFIIVFFVFLTFLIPIIFVFIFASFKRKNFHFELSDKYINIFQGIINKEKRYTPYSVIQNVLLEQDLIDRLLGIITLTIENASSSGGQIVVNSRNNNWSKYLSLGYQGNQINIAGLLPDHALALRNIILDKMLKNPGSISGL